MPKHNFTTGYAPRPMPEVEAGEVGGDRCHHGHDLATPCIICQEEERRAEGRPGARLVLWGA